VVPEPSDRYGWKAGIAYTAIWTNTARIVKLIASLGSPMAQDIPNSVRFVRNGASNSWWPAAKEEGVIHAGFDNLSLELLRHPDRASIVEAFKDRSKSMNTRHTNEVWQLIDHPSQHIWITIAEGCLWWCTVHDEINGGRERASDTRGHFWLTCNLPWSDRSVDGRRQLKVDDPPLKSVAKVGSRGITVRKLPNQEEMILRIIGNDEGRGLPPPMIRR
jgi:hypothetical protein